MSRASTIIHVHYHGIRSVLWVPFWELLQFSSMAGDDGFPPDRCVLSRLKVAVEAGKSIRQLKHRNL